MLIVLGAVRRAGAGGGNETRERLLQGFVISSLVFCVGPLTMQGVGASVLALSVIQGRLTALTALGAGLGSFVPDAHLSALTATGGLLLVGSRSGCPTSSRSRSRTCLPALLVAPLLVEGVLPSFADHTRGRAVLELLPQCPLRRPRGL